MILMNHPPTLAQSTSVYLMHSEQNDSFSAYQVTKDWKFDMSTDRCRIMYYSGKNIHNLLMKMIAWETLISNGTQLTFLRKESGISQNHFNVTPCTIFFVLSTVPWQLCDVKSISHFLLSFFIWWKLFLWFTDCI